MRLAGRTAIVTGAARGIGAATARLFAQQGAAVVIADTLAEQGRAVADGIAASGGQARFVRADVASEADWAALVAQVVQACGRLDILVNNAAISAGAVGDPDGLDGWDRLLAVNAASVFIGTKLAAASMAPHGRGSIVNVCSVMGLIGSADGHPGYIAAKGAVRLYTKAAAAKYGPLGIRVNAVHPGHMPPMLGAPDTGLSPAEVARTPLRRRGEPAEVAHGILFLASDEASFVTGAELVIDGGYVSQ